MILCDFHVHIYDCFDPAVALAAAAGHFQRLAACQADHSWTGVLLLAESRGNDWFAQVREKTVIKDDWRVLPTAEETTLKLQREEEPLFIIAGRQINTREKIEILALGTTVLIRDHLPFSETLAMVQESGAIPVLPWGVGKWSGRRGQLLRSVVAKTPGKLLLGDNAGRPRGWPAPLLFRQPGVKVLPGSDPLPLAGEESRLGSFCTLFPVDARPDRLTAQIKELVTSGPDIRSVGHRVSWLDFLRLQVRLRIT